MANQYKKTTNLPKTGFPMRANLAQNEPRRLAEWDANDVYGLLMKKNEGHDRFVLHDGPPYANGPIHLGHAQNKISKDIINRFWSMRGYQTPYVPGWDCHGQPIEHKVEQAVGTENFNQLPTEKVRELCRKMAVEQVDTQRQGFRRLGVLADWEHPYLTYTNDYDATDVEIFKAVFDSGAIYRGRKPVHWCTHCHTALAEAEIEYGDEVSPAIFVRFQMTTVPQGLEEWAGRLWVDIWPTTPWTLPADDAVILHPEADYVAVVHDGRAELVAAALAERACEKFGYGECELVRVAGEHFLSTLDAIVHVGVERGRLRTEHAGEGVLDVLGGEVGAVVELDALLELEGEGGVVVRPDGLLGGEHRHKLHLLVPEQQGLAHRARDGLGTGVVGAVHIVRLVGVGLTPAEDLGTARVTAGAAASRQHGGRAHRGGRCGNPLEEVAARDAREHRIKTRVVHSLPLSTAVSPMRAGHLAPQGRRPRKT